MFLGGHREGALDALIVQKNLKCQGPVVRGMETRSIMGNGFPRAERVVDTQVQMEVHESFVALVLLAC